MTKKQLFKALETFDKKKNTKIVLKPLGFTKKDQIEFWNHFGFIKKDLFPISELVTVIWSVKNSRLFKISNSNIFENNW